MTRRNCIIYYNFADLKFSSFYLYGFIKNQKRLGYHLKITNSKPAILNNIGIEGELGEVLSSICLFKAQIGTDEYFFCIDARDSATTKTGMGYHIPLLKKTKYYFKVNFNKKAIINDPKLVAFRQKIFPAAPFFPVRISRFIPPMFSKVANWTFRKALRNFRQQFTFPALEEIIRLRNVARDIDVVFVMKFYGHHTSVDEVRASIVKELKKKLKINSIAGLIGASQFPDKYKSLSIQRVPQKKFLSNLARAKTGIYVRGPHDCISFKFGELMAMGKPIVGQKLLNNEDFYYGQRYFNEQFSYETPYEIVDRVVELLSNPEKMSILAKSNANLFDTKLSPMHTAAEIVKVQMGLKD